MSTRRLVLAQNSSGVPLDFEWNAETGAVGGRDAERVGHMLEQWDGRGNLYGTQPADAPDPRHDPVDMAVLLATWGYNLPEELARLLPLPQPVPTGAVA